MYNKNSLILLFSFILLFVKPCFPKDKPIFNICFNDNIKSIQMFPKGWNLASPIIVLNSQNTLIFNFDEITDEIHDFSYRIVHCNADWRASELSEFDYIDGFMENQITDYEFSFNTNINYIHYKLEIPNNDIQIKVSGNYILEVFEDFDKDKIALRKRFMILEPLVKIKGRIKPTSRMEYRDSHQEVDFSIFHDNFDISNPHADLTTVLCQNNRWDGSEKYLKPLFIRNRELVYDYDKENLFPGGNEFRHFDIKSMRYQTMYIESINKTSEDGTFINLFADQAKPYKSYLFDQDLNGNYLIKVQEYDNDETEADYAWVHFTLAYDSPLNGGSFYVFGNFNNWTCNKENKMEYNLLNNSYEKSILFKQGYYNYTYAQLSNNSSVPNTQIVDGSHWETENDYQVYVYYRDFQMDYDRLIGVETFNTLRNK